MHTDNYEISTAGDSNDCLLYSDGTVIEAVNFGTSKGVPDIIGVELRKLTSLYSAI